MDPTTHGSMFVPIILGTDKTIVSVATGQHVYTGGKGALIQGIH